MDGRKISQVQVQVQVQVPSDQRDKPIKGIKGTRNDKSAIFDGAKYRKDRWGIENPTCISGVF
ncbi:MAG: hypothetical protein DRR08_26475 [Candidatus Parabeggiatoa sp. nov. 2]|nr:MAG: hypothetical protein B6247_10255 [Beggiatoa sp. 4572_84]RKZ54398.1 MAG: hypothetical protein DRR08_26475 [Gammaproteobacteria bacterium]